MTGINGKKTSYRFIFAPWHPSSDADRSLSLWLAIVYDCIWFHQLGGFNPDRYDHVAFSSDNKCADGKFSFDQVGQEFDLDGDGDRFDSVPD